MMVDPIGTRGSSSFIRNVISFLDGLNEWISDTAEDLSIPFVDLSSRFRDPKKQDFLDDRWACGDHAHLNVDGYKRMAEVLYDSHFKNVKKCSLVVCLGDSLTQGYPGRDSVERNGLVVDSDLDSTSQFPYWLTRMSGYRFINRGIAGNTVYGMRSRFEREVVVHLPDHCVILGGTNDSLIGTPLEDAQEDLYWLYVRCLELDIVPVCGTIIPLGLSDYD